MGCCYGKDNINLSIFFNETSNINNKINISLDKNKLPENAYLETINKKKLLKERFYYTDRINLDTKNSKDLSNNDNQNLQFYEKFLTKKFNQKFSFEENLYENIKYKRSNSNICLIPKNSFYEKNENKFYNFFEQEKFSFYEKNVLKLSVYSKSLKNIISEDKNSKNIKKDLTSDHSDGYLLNKFSKNSGNISTLCNTGKKIIYSIVKQETNTNNFVLLNIGKTINSLKEQSKFNDLDLVLENNNKFINDGDEKNNYSNIINNLKPEEIKFKNKEKINTNINNLKNSLLSQKNEEKPVENFRQSSKESINKSNLRDSIKKINSYEKTSDFSQINEFSKNKLIKYENNLFIIKPQSQKSIYNLDKYENELNLNKEQDLLYRNPYTSKKKKIKVVSSFNSLLKKDIKTTKKITRNTNKNLISSLKITPEKNNNKKNSTKKIEEKYSYVNPSTISNLSKEPRRSRANNPNKLNNTSETFLSIFNNSSKLDITNQSGLSKKDKNFIYEGKKTQNEITLFKNEENFTSFVNETKLDLNKEGGIFTNFEDFNDELQIKYLTNRNNHNTKKSDFTQVYHVNYNQSITMVNFDKNFLDNNKANISKDNSKNNFNKSIINPMHDFSVKSNKNNMNNSIKKIGFVHSNNFEFKNNLNNNIRNSYNQKIMEICEEESLNNNNFNNKKYKSHTPLNRVSTEDNYQISTNYTSSNKNKGSIDIKRLNYVFGDANNSNYPTKTNSSLKYTKTISESRKISPHYPNKIIKSSIVNNFVLDGDITNMKGRMKKN